MSFECHGHDLGSSYTARTTTLWNK